MSACHHRCTGTSGSSELQAIAKARNVGLWGCSGGQDSRGDTLVEVGCPPQVHSCEGGASHIRSALPTWRYCSTAVQAASHTTHTADRAGAARCCHMQHRN